jgi:hypothetical protein
MITFLRGSWYVGRRGIAINEGGYVCGFTWSRPHGFVDIWFKFPARWAYSYRLTRSGGRWYARRKW